MIDIVPLTAGHLSGLDAAALGAPEHIMDEIQAPGFYHSVMQGPARAVLHAGRVVGLFGLLPYWPGRSHAWALFGRVPRRTWPRLHRHIVIELEAQQRRCRRIEAVIEPGNEVFMRYAAMLGFRYEAYMPAFDPQGRDRLLYARVAAVEICSNVSRETLEHGPAPLSLVSVTSDSPPAHAVGRDGNQKKEAA